MKTGIKENIEASEIKVNPELEKYKHLNLFPEKLEKANKVLKTAKLPKNRYKS